MFKNQYTFFVLTLFSLLLNFGCTKKYLLKDGTEITKKDIIEEYEAYTLAQANASYFRSKKVFISDIELERKDKTIQEFEKINKLPVDKVSGPFNKYKRDVFYVKKGNGSNLYYKTDAINIFQPATINDELFDKEIDRIIVLLEKGDITLGEIKETLNPDFGIKTQYFKNSDFQEEKIFKEEIITFLKESEPLSIFKTEKARLSNVTYLSLVQYSGEQKTNPTVKYLYIRLKY